MSHFLSRGGGRVVEGFWLCHDKTYLIPHKSLYYSNDLPSFSVNKQPIFYIPSIYFGGDDSSPLLFLEIARPPLFPSPPFELLSTIVLTFKWFMIVNDS